MIKTVFFDLYHFARRPDDHQIDLKTGKKFSFIFILLLLELAITFAVVLPLMTLINHVTPLDNDRFDYSDTFLGVIVFWVILVPLIEELIFRYFLRFTKNKRVIFTRAEWDQIFPYLVYIPVLCFGLLHISNFNNTSNLFYVLSPLIVLSQLIGGLIISFIRVRINFVFGTLYHWIWNFLFAVCLPLIHTIWTGPLVQKTDEYTVAIKESVFFNKAENQIYKVDSSQSKILSLKVKQYSMQHLLDSLYTKEKYYVDDVLIDLDFHSEKGLKKEEFLEVLKKKYQIREK